MVCAINDGVQTNNNKVSYDSYLNPQMKQEPAINNNVNNILEDNNPFRNILFPNFLGNLEDQKTVPKEKKSACSAI